MTKQGKSRTSVLRWWLLGGILALTAVAFLVIWQFIQVSAQWRVLYSLQASAIAFGVVWLWAVAASGFRAKTRVLISLAVVFAVGGGFALFRIRGVTGNVFPLLTWRWTPMTPAGLEIPSNEGTTVAGGTGIDLKTVTPSDYPQFLGPDRNGVLAGPRLARNWDAAPPKLLWRRPIGAAWSSFSVVGRHAVTMEQRGELEMVVCYTVAAGEEMWMHADRARYYEVIAGEGPRSTPTIFEGRVYTYGATGILNCLDGANGRVLWKRNPLEEHNVKPKNWGTSCSPLILDGVVVVTVGGAGSALVAYDQVTGDKVWSAGDGRVGYSSPFVTTIAGRRQIIVFYSRSIAGHDPDGGKVLWTVPWPAKNPTVAQPVVVGPNRLLVSSGYGVGSALFEIQRATDGGLSATALWKSQRLKAKFCNMVVRDGVAYSLDDGIFTCMDLNDGRRRWKRGRYGHGQLLAVGDLLLVQGESGAVHLLEPAPDELRELASFQAVEGKTWNHLALSGRYLLIRNSQEAACYELPTDNGER